MFDARSGKTNHTGAGGRHTTGLSTSFVANALQPRALSTAFPQSRFERPLDGVGEHRAAARIEPDETLLFTLERLQRPLPLPGPMEQPALRSRLEQGPEH